MQMIQHLEGQFYVKNAKKKCVQTNLLWNIFKYERIWKNYVTALFEFRFSRYQSANLRRLAFDEQWQFYSRKQKIRFNRSLWQQTEYKKLILISKMVLIEQIGIQA